SLPMTGPLSPVRVGREVGLAKWQRVRGPGKQDNPSRGKIQERGQREEMSTERCSDGSLSPGHQRLGVGSPSLAAGAAGVGDSASFAASDEKGAPESFGLRTSSSEIGGSFGATGAHAQPTIAKTPRAAAP